MRPIPIAILALLVASPALANTYWRDNDRDGYGSSCCPTTASMMPPGYADNPNDCNDNDPGVHPGMGEACNGRDDNCNGAVDEGVLPIPSYVDFDGDGYGQDATMELRCPVPAGRVIYGGDCNDADPRIHPSAVEVCGNGIDDDCDGYVDEFCGAPFTIAAVADRPGDEGHAVIVRFHAHPYDIPAGAPVHVLEYRVQRRPIGVETVPYTWETVATLPATQLADYEAESPTWSDGTPITFVVRAIADVPGVAYDSPPDSGSSLDDTAPEPPASIAATFTLHQVTLDWTASPSSDVALYDVWHDWGPECDLVPACLPVVGATRSASDALTFTGAFDGRNHYWHYWVTAVDTAGNESGAAVPSLVGVTPAAAGDLAFAAPSPNPSRGEVAFSWTMPAEGDVRLAIVDLAGRTGCSQRAGVRPGRRGRAGTGAMRAGRRCVRAPTSRGSIRRGACGRGCSCGRTRSARDAAGASAAARRTALPLPARFRKSRAPGASSPRRA